MHRSRTLALATRAVLAALAGGLLAVVTAAVAAPSYAATCTKVWIGAVSSDPQD